MDLGKRVGIPQYVPVPLSAPQFTPAKREAPIPVIEPELVPVTPRKKGK